jgi:hypothetical protein
VAAQRRLALGFGAAANLDAAAFTRVARFSALIGERSAAWGLRTSGPEQASDGAEQLRRVTVDRIGCTVSDAVFRSTATVF